MPTVELFSDLHCPHAYLLRHHLRSLEEDLEPDVAFRSRCLAIEVDTKRGTPKPILDVEGPLLSSLEPDLPYEPWPEARLSRWPTTFLPAFEAVKAAEALDSEAAWVLDWRIRRAFFQDHRSVALRHELADLAEDAGLPRDAFLEEFDEGAHRGTVLQETREGWYERDYDVSPTLVLPDGTSHENPLATKVHMDPDRNYRVTRFDTGVEDRRRHLVELLGPWLP